MIKEWHQYWKKCLIPTSMVFFKAEALKPLLYRSWKPFRMQLNKNGKPMQILSMDISSAFDSIAPESIYQVMREEQFPGLFVDAMVRLTESGTGRVSLNSSTGSKFDIKNGLVLKHTRGTTLRTVNKFSISHNCCFF